MVASVSGVLKKFFCENITIIAWLSALCVEINSVVTSVPYERSVV